MAHIEGCYFAVSVGGISFGMGLLGLVPFAFPRKPSAKQAFERCRAFVHEPTGPELSIVSGSMIMAGFRNLLAAAVSTALYAHTHSVKGCKLLNGQSLRAREVHAYRLC